MRLRWHFFLITMLVFSVLFLEAAPLKIGWASRDISTELPVKIFGLFSLRISKGVHDPLSLTALVIDNGEDSIIFLSCDLLNVQGGVAKEIRREIMRLAPDCPAGKIILNVTHSHTSGGLDPGGRNGLPEEITVCEKGEYRKLFIAAATDAVVEAWKNRRSGMVAWGYGYAATGFCRRTVFLDDLSQRPSMKGRVDAVMVGHATMYGSTRDDKFSHFESGTDPIVNYLFTFTPEGQLTGAIINLATTAQCGTPDTSMLSADFWNETRLALREKYGPIFILPQCAAAGDMTPRQHHYRAAQTRRLKLKFGDRTNERTIAARLDITEQITKSFDEVLNWAGKDKRGNLPIIHSVKTIKLKKARRAPADVERAKADLTELLNKPLKETGTPTERLQANTLRNTRINKLKNVIASDEKLAKNPNQEMELHAARLGDIAFASNRFELFVDYMHRIQGRSPFEQTFVIQLAGGETGGYLPTARAVANRGYSAEPYSYQVSPDGGQQLVDETVKVLKELKKTKK